MTDQEKATLEAIEAKMQEATKGLASQEAVTRSIEEAKTELKNASAEALKKLEDILAEQGNIINQLKETPKQPVAAKSIADQFGDFVKDNADTYAGFKDGNRRAKLSLKVGTMTIGGNVTGSTDLLPTPVMIPGYNKYRWNPATFWDYAQVRSTNSARIAYVDEVNPDGTPATVTEGSAKLGIDKDDLVAYSSAVKIAASLKISTEMLDDIPFMGEQVNNNLVDRVRLAVSGNIYTYITGLSGILTAVDASLAGTAGPVAGTAANLWQLIVAAGVTINKSNHVCTHVFVNPTDYAKLLMLKGDDQAPVIVSATSAMVNGIMVVSSNAVTVDKYIACDMSKLNVYEYQGLSVEMGWENDDFTKNLRTFIGETRVHYFIRNNDKPAFLYGDITDDLTTLAS